jgi:hypothetical protein
MKVTIEIPQPPETFRCIYPKNAVTTDVKNWFWVCVDTVSEEVYMGKAKKPRTNK